LKIVDLYLADSRVGGGLRRYVVLREGRKWVSLFHFPNLSSLTVDRATYDRKASEARDAKPRTIKRIIRRNLAQAKRLGLPDGGARTKQALEVLK